MENILSVEDIHLFRDMAQVEIDGSPMLQQAARRVKEEVTATQAAGTWYGWWFGARTPATVLTDSIDRSDEIRYEQCH